MHEIKCPHCGKEFNIDEAGYAEILTQVRDEAFDKAIHERLELAEKEKQAAVELAEAKVASDLKEAAAEKDLEIERELSDLAFKQAEMDYNTQQKMLPMDEAAAKLAEAAEETAAV